MMTVRLHKLNQASNEFEHVKDYQVTDDQAFVEMTMDKTAIVGDGLAVADDYVQGEDVTAMEHYPFLYEAGKMVGSTFYQEYVWQSENGSLFEP